MALAAKLLTGVETLPFRAMTFDGYKGRLWTADAAGSVAAIGGWIDGRPAGLALAVRSEIEGLARVASLFVTPTMRRHGLAGRLLDALMPTLAARGFARIELGFRSASETAEAVRRLLARRGWPLPRPDRLLVRCDWSVLKAGWLLGETMLPDDCEIVPLAAVAPIELSTLRASQLRDPWIPVSLNPERYVANATFNSVAMRQRGLIVGWVICERFDERTIIYSSSYIRPDLARRGRILPLYNAAIHAQASRPGWPFGLFVAPYVHPSMVRFTQRRVAPLATRVEDYLLSERRLDDPA